MMICDHNINGKMRTLAGVRADFVKDKLQSRFVFNNPQEKGRCGCGESFHV